MPKTRHETEIFIRKQFDQVPYAKAMRGVKGENEDMNWPLHNGRCELTELLDFIYSEQSNEVIKIKPIKPQKHRKHQ